MQFDTQKQLNATMDALKNSFSENFRKTKAK